MGSPLYCEGGWHDGYYATQVSQLVAPTAERGLISGDGGGVRKCCSACGKLLQELRETHQVATGVARRVWCRLVAAAELGKGSRRDWRAGGCASPVYARSAASASKGVNATRPHRARHTRAFAQVLCNPDLRAKYDKHGKDGLDVSFMDGGEFFNMLFGSELFERYIG